MTWEMLVWYKHEENQQYPAQSGTILTVEADDVASATLLASAMFFDLAQKWVFRAGYVIERVEVHRRRQA